MNFSHIKCRHGASLSGKMTKIVRATRAFTGRISHSTVTWPLPSPGQPPTLESAHPPVAGCIGIQESLTLWLDTPFTSKGKAVKVLPAMLDVQLPFPLEDCFYCFVQFRRNASRTISVLAVAARRATVQQRLDQYKARGIDPVIIDHEGLALWQQGLREKPPRPGISRVVVCLEPDHVSFVIGSGDIFRNAHSLQTPDAEIKPEEIFQRIHRILRAELTAGEKVEWFFCGDRARQPVTVNALHRLLSGEWPGAFMTHKAPETFLPRALACRALVGGAAVCNLRQQDLTHADVQADHRKRAVHAFGMMFLAGLTLCAFNLAWQMAGAMQFKNARQEVARLAGELAPGRAIPYGREIVEAEKAVQKRMDDFAPVLDVFDRPLSTRLAAIINSGREARLSYTRLELSRVKILIDGTTEDWNYCEHLVKRLENIGYKAELERTEGQEDNLVHFIVKGTAQP